METLEIQKRGDGTAVVRLNRPDSLNAMNRQFFRDVTAMCRELDADASVQVGVITGNGRAFSAGGDIKNFDELRDVDSYFDHMRLSYDAFLAVERAAIPFIGAINGMAFGGGCELTMACDLALASDQATFAFPEVTIGLMPGYGVIRGPETIGKRWTRRLAMTAEVIDADTARDIGLVEAVVPHDELLDEAFQLAAKIVKNSQMGVRLAKQFVNRDQGPPGVAESIGMTALLFSSEDHKAKVRAFLDSRRG
jgi:enoyl-CoA hydratase/carnithine racemase